MVGYSSIAIFLSFDVSFLNPTEIHARVPIHAEFTCFKTASQRRFIGLPRSTGESCPVWFLALTPLRHLHLSELYYFSCYWGGVGLTYKTHPEKPLCSQISTKEGLRRPGIQSIAAASAAVQNSHTVLLSTGATNTW